MSDELVVRAIRGHRPDTWTYIIDPLSIAEHGFTDQEAMANLVTAVRANVRDVDRVPGRRRALARRLSAADAEGRLEEVLTAALVLDDEWAERLLREHGEDRQHGE